MQHYQHAKQHVLVVVEVEDLEEVEEPEPMIV
jgi:uncharacterized membrane protein YcgQ (UPF0703/DUF1980 family)